MKCSPDYSFVIFDKFFNLQSIDQVLRSAEALHSTGAWTNKNKKTRRGQLTREPRIAVNTWNVNLRTMAIALATA
jgi:hypothetical protein